MIARIAGALAGLTLGLAASAASAQQAGTETECVSAKTAWSVCIWNEPKECWGVAKPQETVNSRDGKPVSARRGDILLFVTFRPTTGAAGEVAFTGGYPFAPGSTVGVDIEGRAFDLVSDGEWAWPSSKEDDASILAALKAGSAAVVTARSARGTQTKDTFSLNGFTAAMSEAETRCK
jgi:invasion protein IalB